MKKNKKNVKKRTRYNGRNVFGEACIAKFVVLKKETALDQYIEALDDIDAHKGVRIEYTFALDKNITKEEAYDLSDKMEIIAEFRARAKEKSFFCGEVSVKAI
jgi:hypothetical protein